MVEMKRRLHFCCREAAPCAVANLARLPSPRVTSPTCSASHASPRSPSSRSSAPGLSWPSPPAKRSTASPPAGSAPPPPSGATAAATSRMASLACWPTPTARGGPSGFPPLQRAQIIQLACLEPVARGLHITHWSSADLARQAVQDGIVDAISPRSVRRILHAVAHTAHDHEVGDFLAVEDDALISWEDSVRAVPLPCCQRKSPGQFASTPGMTYVCYAP
jgi:hypothetical protein